MPGWELYSSMLKRGNVAFIWHVEITFLYVKVRMFILVQL
jgi:hypothetical protein